MPGDLTQHCIYKAGLFFARHGFGVFNRFIDDRVLSSCWRIDKFVCPDSDDIEQFGGYPFYGAVGQFGYQHVQSGSIPYCSKDKVGSSLFLRGFVQQFVQNRAGIITFGLELV
ncbi:hypothetical protein ES703_71702 [subsurface metagenome]